MKEVNLYGEIVDFKRCLNMMDERLKKEIEKELPSCCSNQEFLNAYIKKHEEKFDGEFFMI